MAITGLSKIETSEYICENDPCKNEAEGATVFLLGAVDKEVIGSLRDELQHIETVGDHQIIKLNTSSVFTKACKVGLRGWRNFKDSTGKDIPFRVVDGFVCGKEAKVLSQESLGSLPFDLIIELGRAIVEKNSKLDSKLLKNLQTQ